MEKVKTKLITVYTLIFIFIFMLFFQDYFKGWGKNDNQFHQDVNQYYSYLPLAIIYGDMDLLKHNHDYWGITAPNGGVVPKVTYGMALMYSPFFLLGHKIAINQHSPPDGYSEPYAICIHYGSFLYCFLGLILLALVLKRFFSDAVTAITLITLFFVTNLFFYTMRDAEMTHSHTFFLLSLLLLLTCKWHEKNKSIYFLWIGLTTGLLALIRPNEILFIVIFIGYQVHSFSDLKEKLRKIFFSYKNIPLFLLGFLILWLPQMIFWKIKTNQFLFFSYGSQESFFWVDPQIINLLFSYRKGWFLYTPVMLFSIIGLFMMKGKNAGFKFPVIIYLLLNIYLLSAWWCWWYGGGFGMRALVQSYAILAIPLAAFYERVFSYAFKKQIFTVLARSLTVALFSIFLCVNQIQTYQYGHWMFHYDSMSKKAYWRVFGRFSLDSDDAGKLEKEFVHPDYEAAMKGKKRN
jgi:hypothetical protein